MLFRSAHDNQMVGIDLGITHLAYLSDGTTVPNQRHTLKAEKQLRIESRSLARKVKGSNNRKKQRLLVSKLHEKIRRTRKDYLHKATSAITKRYGFIAIEDLKVSNMVRNGNLAKHISDAGWADFRTFLEYKGEWYGNEVVAVNPAYTSQTCNSCGQVDKLSRISQSKFVCTDCGNESNADENAAKNILGKGIAVSRQRRTLVHAYRLKNPLALA